jgi:hypothetical protein
MSCSSIDLKEYVLGEMPRREKAALDDHVRGCPSCREELERLNLTRTALLSMEEEEIPRRISFVSDGVFEPRWWQAMWRSGPAMGFAGAALLAAAIVLHAYARPVNTAAPPVNTAQIEQRIERDVNARVDAAVRAAQARQSAEFAGVLAAAEKRYEIERRADLETVRQTARYYGQQMGRLMMASNSDTPGKVAQ